MKRVEGDVYDADELAHVIQDDEDSAWVLASRDDEALGCGVGRPSSIAGSLYAMARCGAGSKRETPHRSVSWRTVASERSRVSTR
jgi:hypothetical protein